MDTYLLYRLPAQIITPEAFKPYGQVILASQDGDVYGPQDAQLQLSGVPRFYLMQLDYRGNRFHKITRHLRCTQCLGSLEGKDWTIGVAAPTETSQPDWERIQIFRVPGDCFIKLEVGTWHAGPYFVHPSVTFYNLELSDTNIVDHDTCNLMESYGVEFEILNSDEA